MRTKVLTAQVKAFELEYKLFCNFRDYSKEFVSLIRETAECIAKLDVFTSFASVAVEHNYVCPVMNESGDFSLRMDVILYWSKYFLWVIMLQMILSFLVRTEARLSL